MANKEEKAGDVISPPKGKKAGDVIPSESTKDLIAKKDFVITHNEHKIVIKKGQVLKNIPEQFMPNLKTEQVI